MKLRLTLLVAAALAASCAADLTLPSENKPDSNAEKTVDAIQTVDDDGTFVTRVDASSLESWVYFDLETAKQVHPDNPDDSDAWDLGFQRFKLKINGGTSGTGQMQLAQFPGAAFDEITAVPAEGLQTDQDDGDDVGTVPDYAFNVPEQGESGPYAYDPQTHSLHPAPIVYAVRSVQKNEFKIEITDYYNEAGSPGYPQFRWARLYNRTDTPDVPAGVEVRFTAHQTPTYLTIDGDVVQIEDPARNLDWDLVITGPTWGTNSGDARGGMGGARLADRPYDQIARAPIEGYHTDEELTVPGAPGRTVFGNPAFETWFNYDFDNHTLSSKGETYWVRSARGEYAKLIIDAAANEGATTIHYTIRIAKLLPGSE